VDPRLRKFIELFNEKYFFEAHEVLEDLWLQTEGETKDFYKGLIQCAVAFVHLERNNFRGAGKLYRTSTGYLHRYAGDEEGLDIEKLLQQFETFFETVVKDAADSGRSVNVDELATPVITTKTQNQEDKQ
jgi:uncharacterized protein